jgi:CheY-like chemotaxis protein
MPQVSSPASVAGPLPEPPLSRVLVVDPDPDTRFLYRTALEPLGVVVSEAEDGAEALGKAVSDLPAVIVTEAKLLRLDGLALCASLRRNQFTAHVHIIVATASASYVVRDLAVAAGANDVRFKPWAIDELVETVRNIIARAGASPRTN